MSSLPAAIFFINGDITYPKPSVPVFPGTDPKISELTTIQTQLYINDTMTKQEFDARIAADPNYPTIVHLQNLRILVIVPQYDDGYTGGHTYMNVPNILFADVVLFLHQGLADVEFNRFGPPCQNYDIQRMTMYSILRAAGSSAVVTLPCYARPGCNSCNYQFYCDGCHTFSGIRICGGCNCSTQCGCTTGLTDNQGVKISPVYLPNCDNEANNINFINRK
jgi:hypothetical protein